MLPLLACRVHFEYDTERVSYIDSLIDGGCDWKLEPMKMIGKDRVNNDVFCVVHGKYGDIYHRAFTGISDIFSLDTKVVDIDNLIGKTTAIGQILFWKTGLEEARKKDELLQLLKSHICLGSR